MRTFSGHTRAVTKPAPQTRFLLSLYHTPSAETFACYHTVVRAGHLMAGPEHHIARDHYPGHELILCLRGRGEVQLQGKVYAVQAGDLVWVDCGQPHAFWAVKADPWEVYWLRFDGPQSARWAASLGVKTHPVFGQLPLRSLRQLFERVFGRLQAPEPATEAWLNSDLAQLVAWLMESRQASGLLSGDDHTMPERLRKPIETMRLKFFEPWRVPQLAAMAGMSPSHFFRVFKQHLGTSPHEWLRRERITHAKRRLIETEEAIKQVAGQCGYSDQFFFSRDFKQVTGFTPTEFRRRERGLPPVKKKT
jgi:AraC family transcriptional regulator, arabinose operon regulatory protein